MCIQLDRRTVARVASLTILTAATAPLLAISPWSAPLPIVANVPLEMAQPLPGVDVGGTKMPVGILFASAPKFQLGLIDPTGAGSMSFATIDAGLALSRKPLAWFEDGFETGNANRWSATAP